MYSQNNEEEFILTFFKYRQRGLFLDIGAFDPFALSNTRALYERGWSGVLVEPGKNQIKKLEDEYKNSDRIEICPYAIAENNGEFDFYATPDDALSTLDEDHLIKWKDINFIKTKIKAITPDFLFQWYGLAFNFINLDIEGKNFNILKLLPFDKLEDLKLICVEYDNHFDAMIKFMKDYKFKVLTYNGENILFYKLEV